MVGVDGPDDLETQCRVCGHAVDEGSWPVCVNRQMGLGCECDCAEESNRDEVVETPLPKHYHSWQFVKIIRGLVAGNDKAQFICHCGGLKYVKLWVVDDES